jgi:hypothetical protein
MRDVSGFYGYLLRSSSAVTYFPAVGALTLDYYVEPRAAMRSGTSRR